MSFTILPNQFNILPLEDVESIWQDFEVFSPKETVPLGVKEEGREKG